MPSTALLPAQPALLLIDFQQAFTDVPYWGLERNNLQAEANAARLLAHWRAQHLPVFHTQHCSANPRSPLAAGQPGNEFMDVLRPLGAEPVIRKSVNSAFIGTNLREQLDLLGITALVIAGLVTDHCVSTTARMAGNYGYATWVVADATATFNKVGRQQEAYSAALLHETALASLATEFATILTTDEILRAMSGPPVPAGLSQPPVTA